MYRRHSVLSWENRLRLAGAGAAGVGAPRRLAGVPPFISAVTYRSWYFELRYSACQSRFGSASKAWNTSAQPGWPKCFSPSSGGPK